MPAIKPLTLTGVDTGSDVATFAFTPVQPQNGNSPSQWANLSKAVREQREVITLSMQRSAGTSPADRVKMSVLIPLTTMVNGVATVVGQPYRADVDIRLPDTGDKDHDEEILSMLIKALQDPLIVEAITSRVAIY